MLIIFILLLPFVQCHLVYTWLNTTNSKVLWNMNNYESIEQVCKSFHGPINSVGVCTSGTAGWKCISVYSDNNCQNQLHKQHTNYVISQCGGDFDDESFDISFNIKGNAYSAKTYNC